jgi:hypothetical protein
VAIYIADLVTGDEVLGYMRLGLSLQKALRPKTRAPYRFVPTRPQKDRPEALNRWYGLVAENDTVNKVLKVYVSPMVLYYSHLKVTPQGWFAEIHYTALQRVRLVSKVNFEPLTEAEVRSKPPSPGFGTNYKPFKTLQEVLL